ncbi:hypothetical protein AOLI_G00329690 [Acnodon oligacanthus]
MWMPNCVFSLVQAAIVPSGQSELNIIWPGGRSTQMPCTAFPPVFTYTLPLPYGRLCQCCDTQDVYPLEGLVRWKERPT